MLSENELRVAQNSSAMDVTQLLLNVLECTAREERSIKALKKKKDRKKATKRLQSVRRSDDPTKMKVAEYTSTTVDNVNLGMTILYISTKVVDGTIDAAKLNTILSVITGTGTGVGDLVNAIFSNPETVSGALDVFKCLSDAISPAGVALTGGVMNALIAGLDASSAIRAADHSHAFAQAMWTLEDNDLDTIHSRGEELTFYEELKYGERKAARRMYFKGYSAAMGTVAAGAGIVAAASLATGPGALFVAPAAGIVAMSAAGSDVLLNKFPRLVKKITKSIKGTKGKHRRAASEKIFATLTNGQNNPTEASVALSLCQDLGILTMNATIEDFDENFSCKAVVIERLMFALRSM